MNRHPSLTRLAAWLLAASLAGLASPVTAGESRVSELNCTACHAASEKKSAWLAPKAAPRLNEAGRRLSPDWLRAFLAAPATTFPGTTMPDSLSGQSAAERAASAEDLTHYLLSLTPGKFQRELPDRAAVERGESLYHKIGCVACHTPLGTNALVTTSAPFPNLVEKWSFTGLRQFLRDPLATRPSGRMPGMNLTDREAADLAHYLLRDTKVPATLEVAQFQGPIRSLADLEHAELARTGPATSFALEEPGRGRGSAMRFSGWLHVEQPGEYMFFLNVSGASRLSLDGDWLTGDESWETGSVAETRKVRLDAGAHQLLVDYVQRGSQPPALKLEWQAPGSAREPIPAQRLSSEHDFVPTPTAFPVDQVKAARGQALYAKLNCAACHESQPAPGNRPPALSALPPDRGCLATTPPAGVPDYHLDASQRTALQKELAALNRPELAAPSPREKLAFAFATFNCTACHVREGKGGPKADRDPFFTSNGTDLGDEGRLPPRLEDVGNKLRPAWLAQVLAEGAAVRPYFNTRMPVFGAANVGYLADLFISLDRNAQPVRPVTDTPEVQREVGRQLTGTDGLSCIVCHRFNRQPAQTMQVIDLITATQRLNEDWFREFLLDPNRFHPGTRMPAFWPGGVSPLPALLGGSTERQHAALWTYLADGPRAKFPVGLSRQSLELIVGGEAVVYRGKLWEAGFRAVATGYPGQLNSAFDAEEMRLALLWRGRFLNTGAHWNSQGMGQIHPQGTDVAVFPHGSAFAVLPASDTAWPTNTAKELGMKFSGYQLDALKQPTLLYSFGGTAITDCLTPFEAGGKSGFHRTLRVSPGAPDGLYFRLARGQLVAASDGAWRYAATVTLAVKNGPPAHLRGTGAQQELLLLLPAGKEPQTLEIDYVW